MKVVVACAVMACTVLADEQVRPNDAATNPNLVIAANLVYSPVNRKVLMVSGAADLNTNALARVWSWDGRAWSAEAGEGPPVRVVGGTAYDVGRKQLVLFGGARPGGGLDDMWAWDGASWRRLPDASVGPRDHHVMGVRHQARPGRDVRRLGRASAGQRPASVADRHVGMDGDRWIQVATIGPSSRGRSAMVYDEKRGEMVLFGGGGDQVLGDTWLWNGERWRMATATGPAPRYAHAMAYDAQRSGRVVRRQHVPAGQYFTDMWEWDGRTWTEINMPSLNPGVRYSPGLAYDRHRRRMVLYGGVSVRDNNGPQHVFDTWEWDGQEWTDVR